MQKQGFALALLALLALNGCDSTPIENPDIVETEPTDPGEPSIVETELTAPEGDPNFGQSVALAENVAIVGTFGAAYIYEREEETWLRKTKLVASPLPGHIPFGSTVSIEGDRALVGTCWGFASVFERNGSAWNEVATFDRAGDGMKAAKSNPCRSDPQRSFGLSGDHAIIGWIEFGDVGFGELGYTGRGRVSVFERNESAWNEVARLMVGDGQAPDYFGIAAAIHGDRIIVGAPSRNFDRVTRAGGAAYIFERNENFEDTWHEVAQLRPSGLPRGASVGRSVSIRGNYALVGVPSDRVNPSESGSAYVYQWNGRDWVERAKLIPFEIGASRLFGTAVSISGDYAIVSALEDGTFVFKREGNDWKPAMRVPRTNAFSLSITGPHFMVGGAGEAYIHETR